MITVSFHPHSQMKDRRQGYFPLSDEETCGSRELTKRLAREQTPSQPFQPLPTPEASLLHSAVRLPHRGSPGAQGDKDNQLALCPKDAEHSRCLVPCQAPWGKAMGQTEAFRSRALTVPASSEERQEASNIPLSSPGLPGEGQRPPQPAQASDMGIGMEATQGAQDSSSGLDLLPLFQSSSADRSFWLLWENAIKKHE